MEFEWARYESFKNFPEESQAYPSQLAKAGFYYVGPGDTVRCFACQCIYKNWKEKDSPAIVHQRVSPACSLQGNINIHGQREAPQMGRAHVPVDDKTLHSVRTSVSTDKRSIDAHTLKEDECCKYKQHAKVSQRHNSFQNWPNHEVQSPKMLAEAGLFYIGIGDVVRCYSCGIELRDWEREDNPWQEHRRFSPNCVHLRLNGHQGGMQSIHSNNSQSDFHLEYGGAHGFEESLSKNMGNDTHPRPLGRDVFNFDSLERSLIRSNAEKSSTECEKQQYLQGSLHNYNLTKVKLQQISLQNMKLKEENIAKENSLKNEIKKLQMKVQELKPFKKSMLCKICLCDNINIVLLPCAHFVCCSQCSTQIQRCCVCRSDIKERVRVYMA